MEQPSIQQKLRIRSLRKNNDIQQKVYKKLNKKKYEKRKALNDLKIKSNVFNLTQNQQNPQKSIEYGKFKSSIKRNDIKKNYNSTAINVLGSLQLKLESSKFRWINEQLYTSSSHAAELLFNKNPNLFFLYHKGFNQQVEHWPVNPVEKICDYIKKMPKNTVVADFGCGNALIARSLPYLTVHSFDLCKINDYVTVANSCSVPLKNKVLDVAVFSLSLMGTDFVDFLLEARRTLKNNKKLIIAEVKSRFCSTNISFNSKKNNYLAMVRGIDQFKSFLKLLGFELLKEDLTNSMFVLFHFRKIPKTDKDEKELFKKSQVLKKVVLLKSCDYKKR